MFYVKEGYTLDVFDKDGNEFLDDLKDIKSFETLQEAHDFVGYLISTKPQNSYVRGIIGKKFLGFDYGSWSHFYFIVSDDKLKYEDIYRN